MKVSLFYLKRVDQIFVGVARFQTAETYFFVGAARYSIQRHVGRKLCSGTGTASDHHQRTV